MNTATMEEYYDGFESLKVLEVTSAADAGGQTAEHTYTKSQSSRSTGGLVRLGDLVMSNMACKAYFTSP